MLPSPRTLLLAWSALALAACSDSPAEVEEPVDPCLSATPISTGDAVNGDLSTEDCRQSDGAYGDLWSLSVSTQAYIRIDLDSNAFDALLVLRDDSGTTLATSGAGDGLDSRIITQLSAGSYIIVARSIDSGLIGSYQLSVREAPECAPITTLALGVSVFGSLAPGDCTFELGGPMDNWQLDVTSTDKLRFSLNSADFDEILLIRNTQGQIVAFADWLGPTGAALLEAGLETGTWTLSVAAPIETAQGAYDLTVDLAPPCEPGSDVVLGATVTGDLSADDCLLGGILPADSFAVNLTQETPLSIHLKSTDFEPALVLFDSEGENVATGLDENLDGSAFIDVTLAPGSYALLPTGFPSQGTYQLTVTEVMCPAAQPITFGETVNGALDDTDCKRATGAFRESWELVLASDMTARIDLESTEFDPYLELKDGQGSLVNSDDDGGDGLNSRIELALTAGTYEIVASSFPEDQTGAYQLTVAAPPASVSRPAFEGSRQELRPKVTSDSDDPVERLARRWLAYRRDAPRPWLAELWSRSGL